MSGKTFCTIWLSVWTGWRAAHMVLQKRVFYLIITQIKWKNKNKKRHRKESEKKLKINNGY